MLQCLAVIGAVLWFPEEGLRSAAPGHQRRGQGLCGPLTTTKVICQHIGTDLDATQHILRVHEKMKKKFREEFGVMVTTGHVMSSPIVSWNGWLLSEDVVVDTDTHHTPVVIQLMVDQVRVVGASAEGRGRCGGGGAPQVLGAGTAARRG